jgi:Tat protein translocase TatB subunit
MAFSEILLILIVALFALGPKQLPQLATWLGKVIFYFKKITQQYHGKVDEYSKLIQLQHNITRAEQAEKINVINADVDKNN